MSRYHLEDMERYCLFLKADGVGIKWAGFMFGFSAHLRLTAADNEEVDFRFSLPHAYRSSKLLSTRFVYRCLHVFGKMARNKGFRPLFWVRDCGSITEEPLEDFVQGLGNVVMLGADAEFVAKGTLRYGF